MSNFSKLLLPILFIGLYSCTPSPKRLEERSKEDSIQPAEEGYSIIFYKLDDYAIVYVDNKQVFDTREIGLRIKEDVLFEMDEFLSKGEHDIKVEGYNNECSGCNQNRWGFAYEIFRDGEGIDYRSDDSNDQHAEVGLHMTNHHSLTK